MHVIEAAAAELPAVRLDDALAILIGQAQTKDPRLDRAAARWVGRLLIETPARLSERAAWPAADDRASPVGRAARTNRVTSSV
jgi:hypothetical protein